MDRIIVAAFVATFIAAVAAVAGVPAFAQNVPAGAPPLATPTPEGAFPDRDREAMVMRTRLVALDTDHDGRISKAEWLGGGRNAHGFDLMDADHDGYLTTEELQTGMAKMRAMRDARRPSPGN